MQKRGHPAPFDFGEMKASLFVFWLTVLVPSIALSQASSTTSASKKAPAKKAAVSKSAKPATRAPSGRTRQMAPTPDRYREIQQALAEKGYFKETPTGVWDDKSTEALRHFQTDQNLTPTGKINAPSLIGLGLGPKPEDMPVNPPDPI